MEHQLGLWHTALSGVWKHAQLKFVKNIEPQGGMFKEEGHVVQHVPYISHDAHTLHFQF